MQEHKPTVDNLEKFFASKQLPEKIQLGPGETITDLKKFLESHLTILKAKPNVSINEVFYLRLIKLKNLLAP